MYCRNCGNALDANATVCTSCGVIRGRGIKFCPNCAAQPDPNASMCVKCGAALADLRFVAPNGYPYAVGKSKTTAGILGILLGGLGVHRFYLGYTTIGIIQIVLSICTFGIAGLWGFIEGILILTGSINTDAAGNPLIE